MIYVADFETITNPTDCRIWAWGMESLEEDSEFQYGNRMSEYIQVLKDLNKRNSNTIYFHNLKFDGEFIIHWLLTHGYTHTTEKKLQPNFFKTLISDMGQWYCIEIRFGDSKYTTRILDSLKVIPFSVEEIAQSFKLPISKLKIDYEEYREPDHILTDDEVEYLKHDVQIMKLAMNRLISLGFDRMTAGSNALNNYMDMCTNFDRWFPKLSEFEDTFVRKSYKGGWTYCNPSFRDKKIGKGIVLDVNSLYPSRMKYELLPYGEGEYYEGRYVKKKSRPLYVQRLRCSFDIRRGKLPTIQLKHTFGYSGTEYLTTTNGDIVELTLTNVDLELFLDHYKVEHLEYIDGFAYRGTKGMFNEYIDYWMGVKVEAEKDGDFALRTIAKLMLNSLYGKFAKRPKGKSKYPYLDEEEKVAFRLGEEEEQGSLYIPVGTFITAYARNYTIRSAQKCKSRFLYADTDSLHLKGTEIPEYLQVDPYELGAWKHESTFKRAKYLGSKCYLECIETSAEKLQDELEKKPENAPLLNFKDGTRTTITCAGLPAYLHPSITYDNFAYQMEIYGKLTPKHVKGGIVLEKITFTLKERGVDTGKKKCYNKARREDCRKQ